MSGATLILNMLPSLSSTNLHVELQSIQTVQATDMLAIHKMVELALLITLLLVIWSSWPSIPQQESLRALIEADARLPPDHFIDLFWAIPDAFLR